MKNKIIFIALLLVFALCENISAQEKRPTVGLVLSGGGAKGVAHVGALKILDSLGIEVDYIAGTSMGAVVGGLHAIGYTQEQLEHAILDTDWDNLMSDKPAREYLIHAEKDLPQRYIFTTSLEGAKVSVPSGILSGNNIEAKLNRLFINYQKDTNFLALPRGFVCIATDLNNAQEMVFTEGKLPEVLRASMSIPTMFEPVLLDGKVLIDGGSINNFPSDKLKALGCDIIIGVDVETTKYDQDKHPSFAKILEKTGMFMNYATFKEREANCDIIISPNMTDYGVTSFNGIPQIYQEGLTAARRELPDLVALAEYLKNWEKREVDHYQTVDSVYITSLSIEGNRHISDELILGVFNVQPGKYYTTEFLEEELKQLYGTNNFKKVNFDLNNGKDCDRYDMVVKIQEKRTTTDIGVGIHFDTDFGPQVLVNVTHRSFLFEGSKLGLDLYVRTNPYAKLYYYYDRGLKPSFGFYSRYYSARPDLYYQKFFQGQIGLDDWSNTFYLQSTSLNRAVVRLGAQLDVSRYNFNKVPGWYELEGSNILSYSYFNFFFKFEYDNLDNSNFANKGVKAMFEIKAHKKLSDRSDNSFYQPYFVMKGEVSQVYKINSKWTVTPKLYGGITFNGVSDLPYYLYAGSLGKNYLNNTKPFVGYRFMELNVNAGNDFIGFAQNMNTFELNLRYKVFRGNYVSALWGMGLASVDLLSLYNSQKFGGFGLKYSIDSKFGPLELAIHKSTESNEVYFYYVLGFWF